MYICFGAWTLGFRLDHGLVGPGLSFVYVKNYQKHLSNATKISWDAKTEWWPSSVHQSNGTLGYVEYASSTAHNMLFFRTLILINKLTWICTEQSISQLTLVSLLRRKSNGWVLSAIQSHVDNFNLSAKNMIL